MASKLHRIVIPALLMAAFPGCSKPSTAPEERIQRLEAEVAQLKEQSQKPPAPAEPPRDVPVKSLAERTPNASGQIERLLGAWQETGGQGDVVEFFKDQSLLITPGKAARDVPVQISGQWRVLADGRLNLEVAGLAGTEANVVEASFDGEEMVITTKDGKQIRHRRSAGADLVVREKRHKAALVLEDLRLLDTAIDQFAIESNKRAGDSASPADLLPYLKNGSRLFDALGDPTGPKDLLGNLYEPFVVDTVPGLHPMTAQEFAGVVPDQFWGPYLK